MSMVVFSLFSAAESMCWHYSQTSALRAYVLLSQKNAIAIISRMRALPPALSPFILAAYDSQRQEDEAWSLRMRHGCWPSGQWKKVAVVGSAGASQMCFLSRVKYCSAGVLRYVGCRPVAAFAGHF